MLPASHLISHAVPGHGPADGKCVRAFSVSPCSSCDHSKRLPQFKLTPFIYTSKGNLSFTCNANSSSSSSSSSGQRRNPDFSRQNRQSYSRNNKNNRQNNEDNIDNSFEDSEVFSSSKNGPAFLSNSNSPPKFQATPGPREREIVEIFRKVQVQLRERAAQKEEKKVEDSQGHNKQNETVDSLLKLLRKHSVQQGKSSSSGYANNRNTRDFVLENHPESNNTFMDDRSSKELNNKVKHEVENTEEEEVRYVRPKSNFQRRSPVPKFKYKPILSGEEESFESQPLTKTGNRKEVEDAAADDDEIKVESEVENETFDESSDEEEEEEDEEETNVIENKDLSSMKLVELREVAKSRGIKGFSRLKKGELLELLTS